MTFKEQAAINIIGHLAGQMMNPATASVIRELSTEQNINEADYIATLAMAFATALDDLNNEKG